MNRWLAAAAVGAIFVSGIGVGALGILAMQHLRPDHPPAMLPPERVLERMLELSEDQVRQVDQLRLKHRQQMTNIRPRVRQELEQLHQQHLAEIREILTEQQRREFDRMRARRDHRFRRGQHPSDP